MSKKITVITPVYKVEEYLPRCIESILAQTHTDIELILINDCSPDGSGAICDAYAKKDSRIRVIHQEKNGGVAKARVAGLSVATGEFVGFVDSDDWIEPEMYASMLALIEEHGADIAECSYFNDWQDRREAVEEGGKVTVYSRMEALEEIHSFRIQQDILCSKLFRRDALPHFDPDRVVIIGEDYSVVVRAFEKIDKLVHVAEPYYHYFMRAGSVCNAGYTERHRGVLENWQEHRIMLSERYPQIKGQITAKMLFQEMAILVAMTKNANYDKEAIKIIARDVRKNFFTALKAKNKPLSFLGSLCMTFVSPRILMWVYRMTTGRKKKKEVA